MSGEINEKMEQIRLKNEELEKKHKEILQDELEAKKQGATVQKSQTTCKTEQNHPYDNVDLDFDVNDDQRELAKNPDYKPKNRRPILGKKQIDEIPIDPVNFLRDDGDDEKSESNQIRRQPQHNSNNRHRNRNPRPRNNEEESEAASYDKSIDPRQRNPNNHRPKTHHNSRNNATNEAPAVNKDGSNSPRKTHPQQLRERRSVQSTDSTEDSNSEPIKLAPGQSRQRRSNNDNSRPRSSKPNREKIDGKNDITVEVTDEVRSVKLKTSERSFGSGRVRHKTENYENNEATEQIPQPMDARKHNRPHHNNRIRKPKPRTGHVQSTEFQHPILDKIVIAKTSVQDRLLRSKMMDDKDIQEPKIESEPIAPAEN